MQQSKRKVEPEPESDGTKENPIFSATKYQKTQSDAKEKPKFKIGATKDSAQQSDVKEKPKFALPSKS
eukprot:5836005-Prymnesium_polylepis.1